MHCSRASGDRVGSLTVRLTREQLVRYAGASGDFNPIHYSDHFATALGLPGVIAHGMLTMGTALRVVTDWVGDPATITVLRGPVHPAGGGAGRRRRGRGDLHRHRDVGAGGVAVLGIEAICDGAKVLGAARAEVTLPSATA